MQITKNDLQCSVSAYVPRATRVEEEGADSEEEAEAQAAEAAYRTPMTRSSGRVDAAAAAGTATAAAADVADKVSRENTLDFVVTVKYARREIRALTDRDRETFFNAVSVMQRVPSAVGREVYGSKYFSKDYFNRMHLYYGERLSYSTRGR